MEGIIEALLEIEQKAEAAITNLKREKDRLPARIASETDHIRRLISQETATAIMTLQAESERSTAARIQTIQDDSAKQLLELELSFAKCREALCSQLFIRLTKWTI